MHYFMKQRTVMLFFLRIIKLQWKIDYRDFLTAFVIKSSNEIEEAEKQVASNKNNVEELKLSLDALLEQEQLSIKYLY